MLSIIVPCKNEEEAIPLFYPVLKENLDKMDVEYELLIVDDCSTDYTDEVVLPPIRSFFARQFYKLINKMIDVEIVDGARDYRLMNRKMVDAIISLPEYNRFSKGIFSWVGFKTKYIEFENVERVAGETKWSFFKLFSYAIDGIVGFTTAPLRLATYSGLFVSFFGFIYMLYIVIKGLTICYPVSGYPIMIAIICLLGGIQLLVIGIMGEYLGKTYMESKKRPQYIVKEIK